MFFSKTFGYAIRSILFLASLKKDQRVLLAEIASKLKVPRHFLAKVMKKLASEGLISSFKGPNGGFASNELTSGITLLKVASITGETAHFGSCVLRLRKCNARNPCPLHNQAQSLRDQWIELLCHTTINDLLEGRQQDFINSVTAA